MGKYEKITENSHFLNNLNEKQQQAIKEQGITLVFAGAGSGKTRTLTYKLVDILKSGISPHKVLALTFTNKAANEMKERAFSLLENAHLPADKVGISSSSVFVGTFHSWGVKFLSTEKKTLEIPQVSIYDTSDSEQLIKDILQTMNLDMEPKTIAHIISEAKNKMVPFQQFLDSSNDFENTIAKVWGYYEKELQKRNAFDFDNLILKPIEYLKKYLALQEKYQYEYVLVDEFQDTNMPQYKLIKLLTNTHKKLFVVGDDYQAIYGFRGTNYKNILQFEEDFPSARTHILDQNYRSTKKILKSANHLIRHNVFQKHKELWTHNKDGEDITLCSFENPEEESEYIAGKIESLVQQGIKAEGIAILYRTNSLSRLLEERLMMHGIQYQMFGGVHFYQRKEIKDILAYVRLMVNQKDISSFKRIINTPARGIGPKNQEKILSQTDEEFLQWLSGEKEIKENGKTYLPTGKFVTTYQKLIQTMSIDIPLSEFFKFILDEIKYIEYLKGLENYEERIANIAELINIASSYDNMGLQAALEEFLQQALLWQSHDSESLKKSVKMMTIHLAKGLEFKVVFVVGIEEGILPHAKSVSHDELEEERRMMYVAMTRAKDKLYLSYARRRRIWGRFSDTLPSRFLREIPEEGTDFLFF